MGDGNCAESVPRAVLILSIIGFDLGPCLFPFAVPFLLLESFGFGGGRGFGCAAGFTDALHIFQTLGHTQKSRFAICRLRAPFGSGDDDAGRTVCQADSGFDLVAVLAARASGDIELDVAISLERLAISRVM